MNMSIIIGGLYAFSASSALFDLTIAILPILLVRKLKMRKDVKIAVAGLLGMACVYVPLFFTYYYYCLTPFYMTDVG